MKLIESYITENKFIKFGSIFLVFIISIYEILNNKEKFNKLKSIFTNKRWLHHFVIMLVFITGIFYKYPVHSIERESTKKGLTALIIAIFASIDLTIAPFWIIWILSYSFDDWV